MKAYDNIQKFCNILISHHLAQILYNNPLPANLISPAGVFHQMADSCTDSCTPCNLSVTDSLHSSLCDTSSFCINKHALTHSVSCSTQSREEGRLTLKCSSLKNHQMLCRYTSRESRRVIP